MIEVAPPWPSDVSVVPSTGSTAMSVGQGGATSIIAVSDRGTMFDPGPIFYMDKLAVGPESKGVIDINASPTENLRAVAKAKGESVRDVTAVILNRPRHDELIAEVREAGARIRLIEHGDAPAAIATAWWDSGVDILFGIGGCTEGVISAAALKCIGGEFQGRLHARNDAEREAAVAFGHDLDKVLTTDDLVRGDNCFFAATGITDGELLRGVHYDARGATTSSLVMRSKSGTVRRVEARHALEKLSEYSSVDFR
jgi:fructose-1,6-bisphosphatase II